jgi:hypothetical protein
VAYDAAREHDGRHVGHVRRLVQDDLVARVAGRAQREVDRLRRADRDQQLGRRVVATPYRRSRWPASALRSSNVP